MKTTKRLNEVIPNWQLGEGIFSALNGFAVPWQYEGIATELDLEYHGNISGEKKISPLVNKVLTEGILTSDDMVKIASVIYTLNHVKWEKEYNTMFLEYNPIENYSMIEKMSDDVTEIDYGRQRTRTDDLTHKKTGSDTNTKNLTDRNTPNTTSTDNATISGFNSSVSVPDRGNVNTLTGTDTTTHTGTDSVSYNTTDKDTGTVTDKDSGKDTHTRNYKLTRSGNIGTLTSQQMLESERNLYLMWQFFYDVVFPDVDKVLTLSVY